MNELYTDWTIWGWSLQSTSIITYLLWPLHYLPQIQSPWKSLTFNLSPNFLPRLLFPQIVFPSVSFLYSLFHAFLCPWLGYSSLQQPSVKTTRKPFKYVLQDKRELRVCLILYVYFLQFCSTFTFCDSSLMRVPFFACLRWIKFSIPFLVYRSFSYVLSPVVLISYVFRPSISLSYIHLALFTICKSVVISCLEFSCSFRCVIPFYGPWTTSFIFPQKLSSNWISCTLILRYQSAPSFVMLSMILRAKIFHSFTRSLRFSRNILIAFSSSCAPFKFPLLVVARDWISPCRSFLSGLPLLSKW